MNQECENGPNAEWEMGDDIQGRCKTQNVRNSIHAQAQRSQIYDYHDLHRKISAMHIGHHRLQSHRKC
jgi:type VI protein secretion system component Hcp